MVVPRVGSRGPLQAAMKAGVRVVSMVDWLGIPTVVQTVALRADPSADQTVV